MNEIGDDFLKNAEYAAVGRVQLKGESLARKAVLMNGCIWEGPDGVLGPCLIRKSGGLPELCPRRELLRQWKPHTSEKPELRNLELHQRPGAISQRTY